MERVVFVDRALDFASVENPVVLLPVTEVAALADTRYNHNAGLPYLLRILPSVCQGVLPYIAIVGVLGDLNPASIEKAAVLALEVVNGDV
jgi:hypothetical protein